MKRKVGIWIDRKKAVIIAIGGTEEEIKEKTRTIFSGVERRIRPEAGDKAKKPFGPSEAILYNKEDRRFAQQIEKYFEQVRKAIKDANCIYIAGPGEAKIEFKKYLEKTPEIAQRIKQIEAVDKLTDRQFAAMVRDFYCIAQ